MKIEKFNEFSNFGNKEPEVGDRVILEIDAIPAIISRFLKDEINNEKILNFLENNIGKIIDRSNSSRPGIGSTWYTIKFDKKIPVHNFDIIEVRKWEFKLELNVISKKYNL